MWSTDRLAIPAAVVLLIALAAQCFSSMRLKSATYDEPTYLAAGYVALTTGIDLNPAHPPLMKYLLAAPLLFVDALPAEAIPHWPEATRNPQRYGTSFLFENRADPDTLLFVGRSAVVVVSLLLAGLVWIWARQLYGPGAATVALGLYAFCPNLIAHSTVATLDLGITAGVAAASYALWRAYTRPTMQAGAWAGAALAAALLMKSTALILVGLLPIQLGAALLWHRRRRPPARQSPTRAVRRRGATPPSLPTSDRRIVRTTLVAVLVAAVGVSVAYGSHRFGIAEYVTGFRLGVLNRNAFMNVDYRAFCWGRYSSTGFPWYFLAAFLLKTPVPTLVLTAATIAWLVLRRPRRIFDELFLVLPIATFFLATTLVRDNLGLRYILPVYPLLYVLIGGMTIGVSRWTIERLRSRPWSRRFAATGATLLASGYVAGTLWIYPNYLAYFNGLFCGPADGIRYLDDSNIDWGQDFKQLARYLHDHDITHVKGLYNPLHLTPYVARYYGVALTKLTLDEIRHPQPGWYAISAHLLQRPSLSKDPAYRDLRFDWLDRFTPVARIGYSIYLYHFD